MNPPSRKLWLAVSALVVFGLILSGCQGNSSPVPPDPAEMKKADDWLRQRDEKMVAGKEKTSEGKLAQP